MILKEEEARKATGFPGLRVSGVRGAGGESPERIGMTPF
jgi:hypothetical protein